MHTVSQVAALLISASLFISSPAYADPIPWSDLNKPQQFVLSGHKSKWGHYSEGIQKKLLKDADRRIQLMEYYKAWIVKNLSKQEILALKKAFRNKSRKDFKKHMDKLITSKGGLPPKKHPG